MNAARLIDGVLGTTVLTCLAAAALCWLGPALDAAPDDTRRPTGLQLTLAAERADDLAACQRTHGAASTPAYLPDGQHRCTSQHQAAHFVQTRAEVQP